MTFGRRLKALEGLRSPRLASGLARERLREHLDRVAALRRGDLAEEERAEVEATSDAIWRRMAEIREDRGEGA